LHSVCSDKQHTKKYTNEIITYNWIYRGDNRKRGFRLKDNFGQHRDANYLMRYKDQFKNSGKFLELMNNIVPFLNGGLFECLDNKTDKIYIDGFSDKPNLWLPIL